MKVLLKIFILLLFLSCTTETKVTTNTNNKILENGKHLKVDKTTKKAIHIGIITKKNYGTTYSFSYNFTINKNEVKWGKNSAEPKNIIFTQDTVYVKSLEKKSIPHHYSVNDSLITKHRDSIMLKFEAYIDNRYFFKMFGDDFWIDISTENYQKIKENHKEFNIPNDNEYQIKKE